MEEEKIIKFLHTLGFKKSEEREEVFVKNYPQHSNYKIKIEINLKDIKKSLIFYNPDRKTTEEQEPEPKGYILLGDLTTSNFENPENFVVLECVNRLLEIGYKPENIHLERKWKLGRTGKSGKADITVYYPKNQHSKDKKRETFMIIECKTWGEEFEKEKRNLFKNGGQLFSYFQQARDTKILSLYTSIFEDDITYDSLIIKMEDDPKLVEECKEKRDDEKIPCSFEEAPDVPSLVDVWKRVYRQYVFKHGIFELDAGTYSLELKPLKKKNLIELKSSQGLFNAFAEILRHHNISDTGNAFNKMMSLFLCKIVDEETKDDDDVLDFQVKLGETFEQLVDRLQRLYQIGMKKYLGLTDFVYYSDEDIESIIRMFPKRAKLEEILEMFREIKYYTNNEFAFKEVHNKELFYQNALILTEIIELLQSYRLKYSHKNQILGDFFELLLNHGVKQSEGQFFTPLPIVRFMIIASALDKYMERKIKEIEKKDTEEEPIPKILDYACGVAHFLTEAIDEINKIIDKHNLQVKLPWEERYIFGIEKDYRLARTAKIACFLNGDGSANIIHGDGLDDYPKLDLKTKKFDFILTNPPYSIKKFKNYLEVKPKYELLKYLTPNSSEIEVLFVERAKQVLDEGGRIAIILPSSILSNSGVYTKTRELILKHFEIKGIAEFGSQTFIATGTNTVILFLEKRGDWFYKDRWQIATEIFDEKCFAENDYIVVERLFNIFVNYRELPLEDYKKFVFENELTENLMKTEIFESYKDWFDNLTEVKNLKKKKSFISLSKEEQKERLEELFKEKVRQIEKEKFFYFSLMFKKGENFNEERWYEFQKVVIARAPSKTDEQKKYLGYEFNKRRGFEGIEIYKDNEGKPTTKLYDDEDYENPQKIASYIRKNFENEEIEYIDDEVKEYLNIYNFLDLFDFDKPPKQNSKEYFEKEINLSERKKIFINTKWKLVRLSEIETDTLQGLTFPKEVQSLNPTSKKVLTSTHIGLDYKLHPENPIFLDESFEIEDKYKLRKGDIFISTSSGSLKHLGKFTYIDKDLDFYAGGFCAILRGSNLITQKYISEILKLPFYETFINNFKGQNINNLKIEELKKLKIPLPPLEIQEKIVSEIEKLEEEEEVNNQKIQELEKEIEEKVKDIFENYPKVKIGNKLTLEYGKGLPKNKRVFGKYPVVGSNGIDGWHNEYIVKAPAIIIGRKGSAGKVNLIKENCYPIDTTYYVKLKNENENMIFYYYLLKYLEKDLEELAKGSGVPGLNREDVYKLYIPGVPIKVQKQLISEIEKLEKEINKLKEKNKQIEEEKKEVLGKLLSS